jgi:hypothetical protein
MLVEFIEAALFTPLLPDYLSDDGYHELQRVLTRDPDAGEAIPGTGGFRKLHWADRRRGKEKRGGLRVIYYDLVADTQIWFVTVYDKDEASDLSADEKRALEGGHRVGIATACRAAKTAAEVSDGQEEKERRSHATISAHAGRSPCGDRRDAPASRLARRVAGLTGRSLIDTFRLIGSQESRVIQSPL